MTKAGLAAPLVALILLPMGSVASTLHAETASSRSASLLASDAGLMRRESRSGSLNAPAGRLGCGSVCTLKDFLMGIEKSNSCRYSNETRVIDEDECVYAAGRNNAELPKLDDGTLDADAFKLREEEKWQVSHPHGCFHAKCHFDATKDCYYFNSGALELSNTSHPDFDGTPVCMRNRYEDGAPNAHGGCPPEYQVIFREPACVDTCTNLNDQCSDWFRIGMDNYSMHFLFPPGCFHMRDAGGYSINGTHSLTRVYFNSLNYSTDTNVSGTPICEVAQPLNCGANPGCGVGSGQAMSVMAGITSALR